MNDEQDPLISRLRAGLDAATDGIDSDPPGLGHVTATPRAGHRRAWLTGVAAAALVGLTAAGIFVATSVDEDAPQLDSLDPRTAVAETPDNASSPTVGEADQLYRATATVLEDKEHGPQLCLGDFAGSLPPQCGGLDVTNWDWQGLASERASGTRWGEYVVVGTYDREAQTFTLSQPAREAQPGDYTQASDDAEFPTPCDEPPGGWPQVSEPQVSEAASRLQVRQVPDDPTGTTRGDQTIDGFGGLWLGSNPRVLNVRIVGDAAAADADIREFYDGPLCLIPSERTYAELVRIQDQITTTWPEEMTGIFPDVVTGQVIVELVASNAELERRLSERYGDAVQVTVTGLVAIAPGEDPDPGPGSVPPSTPAPTNPGTAEPGTTEAGTEDSEYRAAGFVLEDDSHGPQLCFGSGDSYPPQCGGIDITNWNWDDVTYEGGEDAEEPTTARWGDYVVVGTYDRDANTFTLTEPARPVKDSDFPEEPERDDSTPCDEPEGGWPAATEEDLANAANDIDPEPGEEGTAIVDGLGGIWFAREPFVLNVAVTGDVDDAETAIRAVYDGPLCIVPVRYTEAELIERSQDLYFDNRGDIDATGVAVERNVVEVVLLAPDPEFEASLDEQYGDAVEVIGYQLQPVLD